MSELEVKLTKKEVEAVLAVIKMGLKHTRELLKAPDLSHSDEQTGKDLEQTFNYTFSKLRLLGDGPWYVKNESCTGEN